MASGATNSLVELPPLTLDGVPGKRPSGNSGVPPSPRKDKPKVRAQRGLQAVEVGHTGGGAGRAGGVSYSKKGKVCLLSNFGSFNYGLGFIIERKDSAREFSEKIQPKTKILSFLIFNCSPT